MSVKGSHLSPEPPNEFSLELYAITAWFEAYTVACEAFAEDLKTLVEQRKKKGKPQEMPCRP